VASPKLIVNHYPMDQFSLSYSANSR
jgi:hypothetical protein